MAIPLDTTVCLPHQPLQREVPTRSTPLNNPPTFMGQQVVRVPILSGIQTGLPKRMGHEGVQPVGQQAALRVRSGGCSIC
jgi:hypothetical protein